MSERERVLVVDEISDTAEVLQAVLGPRGLTVNRVSRLEERSLRADRPAVLVLDADSSGATAPDRDDLRNVPQIIIGTWHASARAGAQSSGAQPERRYLQKPFHFADLVRAIESLIAR